MSSKKIPSKHEISLLQSERESLNTMINQSPVTNLIDKHQLVTRKDEIDKILYNQNKTVPTYLKEGLVLSRLPLYQLTNMELTKLYAYEVWKNESATSPIVSFITDRITTVSNLEAENAKLKKEHIDLEDEFSDLKDEFSDLKDEFSDLEDECENLKNEYSILEDECADLEEKNRNMENENEKDN